jgi:phosphoribosylaminoimidazolecarboxamide formyltransferase/IMP cyclohydrolase
VDTITQFSVPTIEGDIVSETREESLLKVRRALISVSDKRGIVELAKALRHFGVEIISTGGTHQTLKDAGVEVKSVSELTGFPEILDGRVKTLHPAIHGGILAAADNPLHLKQLQEHHIDPIDLVVVNLYPFEQTITRENVTLDQAVEQIDIGGPAMLRAAAKNFHHTVVIVNPNRYQPLMDEMMKSGGAVSSKTRFELARETFQHTATYDTIIAAYFSGLQSTQALPDVVTLSMQKSTDLRYGENPHQAAALYGKFGAYFKKLHGKELSYNNILDVNAAALLSAEFEKPTAVIVKHNNPCGVGIGDTISEAFGRAFACDPLAAFGGIIAIRGRVDGALASLVLQHFVEVVAADDFTEEAVAFFSKKPNIRLLRVPVSRGPRGGLDWKRIEGGLLVQDSDSVRDLVSAWRVVSQRKPTAVERAACELAWKVVRRVKSNAIVLANARQTIGIGAGQMSRVDACRLAASKPVLPIVNCGAASDAFFPFRDGLDVLADAGVTAVVAPGGSIRDQEIVAEADQRQLAFLLAPKRHFRH